MGANCKIRPQWPRNRCIQLLLQKYEIGVILRDMSGHARPTAIFFMVPWGRLSPQSKLHRDRFGYFCTGDHRVSLCFAVGAPFPLNCPSHGVSGPRCKTRFLGPIRAHRLNGIFIGSAVFPQTTVECPYTLQWNAHSPPKIFPFPWGDQDPHLIHCSTGPPKSSIQTAARSVQPFLQGSLV